MLSQPLQTRIVSTHQTVWGSGVGEKPANLERYRNLIHSVGFKTNPQLILGADLIERIHSTGSDKELRMFLADKLHQFSEPMIVRSAAISGDALGVGAYKSYFTNKKEVIRHILSIISQFHNEDSKSFRRLNDITSGLSISIESVIGNRFNIKDQEWVSPLIAGAGYSSSASGAYLTVGSGLGFTLMTNPGDGILVFKKDSQIWHERLSKHFLVREYGRMFCSQELNTLRMKGYNSDAFDLSFVFDGLTKLQSTENPVYIEYAVAGTPKKPEFYITQIAEDVPVQNDDAMQFVRQNPINGLINLTGDVQGAARFDCKSILFLPNYLAYREPALKALQEFNALGRPYILLINSEFLHTSKYLPESYLSNAQLILGVDFRYYQLHRERISSHITQRRRQSKVISAGVNVAHHNIPTIREWYEKSNGSTHVVISGDFQVGGYEINGYSGRLVLLNKGDLLLKPFK